jgi:hypothetical protein
LYIHNPSHSLKMAEPSAPNPPPPTSAPEDAWKHTGVRVIPADSLDSNTPQTPGISFLLSHLLPIPLL